MKRGDCRRSRGSPESVQDFVLGVLWHPEEDLEDRVIPSLFRERARKAMDPVGLGPVGAEPFWLTRARRIGLSDGRSDRSIRTTPGAFSSSQATSSELKPSPFVAPAATTRSKRSCSISRRNACRTLRPGSILESTGTLWVAARCSIARGTERSDRGRTGWPRSTQKRRGGTGRRQHLGASKQVRRCGPRDSPRHCCSDEPTASKACSGR